MAKQTTFQRQVERQLERAGLPYRIDDTGKKHLKLYMQDKFVMVISRGTGTPRDLRFLKSIIRKEERAKHADN